MIRRSTLAIPILVGAGVLACGRGGAPGDGAADATLCLRESPTIPFVAGDTATLQVGPVDERDTLCLPAEGGATWRSSRPEIASVSGRGVLVAIQPGRTTIVATRGDETDSATFLVVPRITDVRILPDSVTLDVGDSATFRIATVGDVATAPVWWYAPGRKLGFAPPGGAGGRDPAPASITAEAVTVWAREPGEALLVAGTRYLRDAAHVRVVVR